MLMWLLTYLVHSTVLLGLVALSCRFLNNRQLSIEEPLWRLAALGGVVTSTVQLALGVRPLGGSWSFRSSLPDGTTEIAALANSGLPAVGAFAASSAEPLETSLLHSVLDPWLILFWIVGAVSLVATLALAYLRLEGRLRNRRRIESGPLVETLAELTAGAVKPRAVILSSSKQIAVPLAKGWWKREICLPERTLRQMSSGQHEAILAHELAHLERHDPLWLGALHLLESALFVQPLNRLARRRLQEIAEYRCDDWAVHQTGQPLTLAKCLADVAEYSVRQNRRIVTPALASRGRFLSHRVARLLDRGCRPADSQRPIWLVPLAFVLLVLTVVAAPGFTQAQPEEPTPPLEPVAEAAPVSPAAPEPVAEPIAPVAPVPSVPAPDTVPVAPREPAPPLPPAVPRTAEPTQTLQELEARLRIHAERLADQRRDLERVKEVELERLQEIRLERAEALESELEAASQLRRSHEVELRELRQETREFAERQQQLHREELRELREEQVRIQRDREDLLHRELRARQEERTRLERDLEQHRQELRERQQETLSDPEESADGPGS